jgi:hypothetical protein
MQLLVPAASILLQVQAAAAAVGARRQQPQVGTQASAVTTAATAAAADVCMPPRTAKCSRSKWGLSPVPPVFFLCWVKQVVISAARIVAGWRLMKLHTGIMCALLRKLHAVAAS